MDALFVRPLVLPLRHDVGGGKCCLGPLGGGDGRRRGVGRAPTMLLNGRPKSKRPKLRKGYKPPRLTRQLKWGIEDLEEHVLGKRYHRAYNTFVLITQLDIVPELSQYHDMILLMGLMGPGDAEMVIEDMRRREVVVGTATLNEMIKVYGRRKDVEGMRLTLARIDDSGLKANGDTFSALVEGFVKSGDVEGAKWSLEEMKHRKVTREFGSFLARMRLGSFLGDVDMVEDGFFEMTEQYGYVPTVYVYNLRIASFAAKGEAFACEETLTEMVNIARLKPNDVTFNVLIKMYVTIGDVDKAKETFQRMKDAGLKPGDQTFAQLMRGLKEQEDSETIEMALGEMKRNRMKVAGFRNNFDTLLQIYAGEKKSGAAFDVLKRMLKYDINPQSDTYRAVFAPAVVDGKLLDHMAVEQTMAAMDVEVDRFFMTCLFDGYLRLEQPALALELVESLIAERQMGSMGMISVLIGSYCRRGNPYTAIGWLDLLLSMGIHPNPKAFAYVVGALSTRLDERRIVAVLHLMKRYGVRWHTRQRVALYETQSKNGNFLPKLKLLRQVDELKFDRHAAYEFTMKIKRGRVETKRGDEEPTVFGNELQDGAQRDEEIYEEVIEEVKVDMDQNLIMARLTDLVVLNLEDASDSQRNKHLDFGDAGEDGEDTDV